MGLFSGKNGRNLAMWQAGQLNDMRTQGDALIALGKTDALGSINAGEPLSLAALDAGQGQSLAALGKGFDAARGAYGDARAMYQPYADRGAQGFGLWADSTGAGGQAGYDRAFGSFRADPGYQYRVDQGTDAVARKASAMGALGSGNAMNAVREVAQNEADQGYSKWQGGLRDLGQVGMQATGAQAGLTKGIGDLFSTQGTAEASIYDTNAQRRASIYDTNAARRAGIHTGAANQGVNLLGSYTNGLLKAGEGGFRAGDTAAANNFSALMGLGSILANGIGQASGAGGGGGGALSALSKIFGGGR